MLKQERFKNVPTASGGNNEMSVPVMWQADKYQRHPATSPPRLISLQDRIAPSFVLCWKLAGEYFHTLYSHQENDYPSYTHKETAEDSCYNIYTHAQRQYRNLIRLWRLRRGFWLYYAHHKAATYTEHKHRINQDRHLCFEWDSNPRSQCLWQWRQFQEISATLKIFWMFLILCILWRINQLLGNDSVNTFPRELTCAKLRRLLLENGSVNTPKTMRGDRRRCLPWGASRGYITGSSKVAVNCQKLREFNWRRVHLSRVVKDWVEFWGWQSKVIEKKWQERN
jgi:hypothetical protein